MATNIFTLFFFFFVLFLFMLLSSVSSNAVSCKQGLELGAIQLARSGILHARNWADEALQEIRKRDDRNSDDLTSSRSDGIALSDCVKLYEDCEPRLAHILSGNDYNLDDAMAWLSAAMASHRSCLDGLEEKGNTSIEFHGAQNLTILLDDALSSLRKQCNRRPMRQRVPETGRRNTIVGLLASWDATNSKADLVVAQDGSGNYKTINDAVDALSKKSKAERTVIHIKAGVYHENVEVGKHLKNVMFVGDGMEKTIVTGHKSVIDGSSTLNSATFGISGDGFWARDMTFENTAGPEKHQAVALRVSSDLSIFYRCSFKGYQDTLFVHSLRQFYRDCHIYGTVDYIFGDAAVVFQNCDIFVRKPMNDQSNMITAQGRDNPNESTGISIINCRVSPSSEFSAVKGKFNSYLGRPWKKYSRTVFLKTDLDGLIDPRGWKEWDGNFALSTLYYGEYMNTGHGASTSKRVKWPGFHVMHQEQEANSFSVTNFIQGNRWIPASGVPFSSGI